MSMNACATLATHLGAEAAVRFKDAMAGSGNEDSHWLKAIEGECALILGELETAAKHYAAAQVLAERRRRLGDVASMRRQAKLLLNTHGLDEALAQTWLPLPRIAVFSGHLVDAPGRGSARLPVKQLEPVATAIRAWLSRHQVRIAVCSLSAGADLLFADMALRCGAELHIVLPASRAELLQLPLIGQIPDGPARIERVLSAATSIRELGPDETSCDIVDYVYLNEMLLGTAGVPSPGSRWRSGGPVGLGWPAGGAGGSADAVRRMRETGWTVTRIDPLSTQPEPVNQVPAATPEFDALSAQLKALVFGDFVGFSKLAGAGLKDFYRRSLPPWRGVSKRCRTPMRPVPETPGVMVCILHSRA
ncbi:MAG: hypothetical protein IPK97_04385 [Ahniella sp.]|nr:hypothetical protein [Ahniella sp.]